MKTRVFRSLSLGAVSAVALCLLSVAAWVISIGFSTDLQYAGTPGQPLAFIVALLPGLIGSCCGLYVISELIEE